MAVDPSRVLNCNVGILGHVDSGKTSLARALSTHFSTASLDKAPQSAARGITLDLGFSSFQGPVPGHVPAGVYDTVQYTLVDCPGHASLIRTVLGGAQIIDVMMLVVDITKGIQTQTAECLVVGELTTENLIVVLNKVDMLPADSREKAMAKMVKRLENTFRATRFPNVKMVPVSARPGGGLGMEGEATDAVGMTELVAEIERHVPSQPRPTDAPLLYAVDHCFPIKGQGTVLTGTVLQGSVEIGQTLEFPILKQQRKVKSMQMFRKPVQKAKAGDRLGICVTQFDATLMERGLVAEPSTVPTFTSCIAQVEKIRFHKGDITSKTKFHLTIGHQTVMATARFCALPPEEDAKADPALARLPLDPAAVADFDFSRDYAHRDELLELPQPSSSEAPAAEDSPAKARGPQYALLVLESPVTCPLKSLLIGSKLDADIHVNACRLAFHGRLLHGMDAEDPAELAKLRVYKVKHREGTVERVEKDGRTAVGRGMFKKETDMSKFAGMQVVSANGEKGTVQGSFGKSGKFKMLFPDGIAAAPEGSGGIKVTLNFKKYLYDTEKKMIQ
mmetsp:Transcript_26113/g.85801  ORF Transcript_26113/g.85801 Transcript_26113/m.85801 type:complete len:561 (+) Transcript_26113:30-1712(+)